MFNKSINLSISKIGKQTFLPCDATSSDDWVINETWRIRQARFICLFHILRKKCPHIIENSLFESIYLKYLSTPVELRRKITRLPIFKIWLTRISSIIYKERKVEELSPLLLSYEDIINEELEKDNSGQFRLTNTSIFVERENLGYLIKEAIEPSYIFNNRAAPSNDIYTTAIAYEIIESALRNIDRSWSPAFSALTAYVRTIVHLPDAGFRSCSASRYAGIILLSGADSSLIEIEESICHELGHQILYYVNEIWQIIGENAEKREIFALPWSGSKRDTFGYFHAIYIYLLLVIYYRNVILDPCCSSKRKLHAEQRRDFIMAGLRVGFDEIGLPKNFTAIGWELFQNIKLVFNTEL
jgi:hypothetical protein